MFFFGLVKSTRGKVTTHSALVGGLSSPSGRGEALRDPKIMGDNRLLTLDAIYTDK